MKLEDKILGLAIKYKGDDVKITKAINEGETSSESEIVNHKKRLSENGCHFTTIVSEDYPSRLRKLDNPPIVLFYYGDLSLLDNKTVAVIGMREPSNYGKVVTSDVAKKLNDEHYVIISGLAKGVDSIAHNNADRTIAVLGCGIDYCYPKENKDLYQAIKENHLLMSEYPFDTPPQKHFFLKRNRIVAGLSDKIIVTECKDKSGTMNTVNHALEQGKDVYAVPSSIYGNIGCNILIECGVRIFWIHDRE